jgi:energy-coupling factor transport system permease protein
MIRDITIGQYYNTDSLIHRLDARTKLVMTLLYAITLFLCNNLWMFITATVFLAVYVGMSHVPFTYILKGLKVVWIFIIFTALFSLFNGDGKILFSIWKLSITTGSLKTTGIITFRLFYLIIGSSIMTYTTMPLSLTAGLEKLLGFLKVFHVPVAEMAMMMSITLRFIPVLMEELDKIMKAQLSRGADFESGNIFRRVKSYVPVLIPLFVSAIRRASELAMAMDARCYHGSDGRTCMKPLKYEKRDYTAYCILGIYVAGVVALRLTR